MLFLCVNEEWRDRKPGYPLPPNAIDGNIVIGAANFIFSSLRIQAVTANILADQLSQTPRARAGIRPAMRHDCRRIFPMDSPQSRASLRVIKPSSKLNRQPQPKIKSGKIAKAEKNNYSNFAATAVLAVAGILLALSLSHLAAGLAPAIDAGPSDGWLMAIGIDLGFIVLEVAVLAAPADKRAAMCCYAAPAIIGTVNAKPAAQICASSQSNAAKGTTELNQGRRHRCPEISLGGQIILHLKFAVQKDLRRIGIDRRRHFVTWRFGRRFGQRQ
jgi:hypothetical protein